jgi:Cu/Ag efflux protein CusF
MAYRIFRLAIVTAALALGATSAVVAQGTETRGIVQRVDVPSGTVYFTDGRIVNLDAGARLSVDGRPVSLADVQPGWTLIVPAAAARSAAPVVAVPAPAWPPVDATGVVSRVDPVSGTITLEDGRVLRVTDRTSVWQPVPVTGVRPGAAVHVRGGEPVDFRPGAAAGGVRYQMGTVGSVDATGRRVTLTDGSVVHLAPGSRIETDGRSLAITELRAGDEVVVGVPAGSTVSVASAGASALPARAYVIESTTLYVVRRPQSP